MKKINLLIYGDVSTGKTTFFSILSSISKKKNSSLKKSEDKLKGNRPGSISATPESVKEKLSFSILLKDNKMIKITAFEYAGEKIREFYEEKNIVKKEILKGNFFESKLDAILVFIDAFKHREKGSFTKWSTKKYFVAFMRYYLEVVSDRDILIRFVITRSDLVTQNELKELEAEIQNYLSVRGIHDSVRKISFFDSLEAKPVDKNYETPPIEFLTQNSKKINVKGVKEIISELSLEKTIKEDSKLSPKRLLVIIPAILLIATVITLVFLNFIKNQNQNNGNSQISKNKIYSQNSNQKEKKNENKVVQNNVQNDVQSNCEKMAKKIENSIKNMRFDSDSGEWINMPVWEDFKGCSGFEEKMRKTLEKQKSIIKGLLKKSPENYGILKNILNEASKLELSANLNIKQTVTSSLKSKVLKRLKEMNLQMKNRDSESKKKIFARTFDLLNSYFQENNKYLNYNFKTNLKNLLYWGNAWINEQLSFSQIEVIAFKRNLIHFSITEIEGEEKNLINLPSPFVYTLKNRRNFYFNFSDQQSFSPSIDMKITTSTNKNIIFGKKLLSKVISYFSPKSFSFSETNKKQCYKDFCTIVRYKDLKSESGINLLVTPVLYREALRK